MEFAFVVYLVSTVLPLIASVGAIAVVLTCGIVLCLFVALPLWGVMKKITEQWLVSILKAT